MDIYNDPIYNLTYEKALTTRAQYESIIEQSKATKERLQNRRKRICKKLDKEIEDCNERIHNSESVIEVLDQLYFNRERQ